MMKITDALFPSRPSIETQFHTAGGEFPLFTMEEVDKAVHKARRKSTTPGIDNITGRILSVVNQLSLTMLTGLYNQCVRDGIVPAGWKRARVVLVEKGRQA